MAIVNGLDWLAGPGVNDLAAVHFEFNSPVGFETGLMLLLAAALGAGWYSWTRLSPLRRRPRWALSILRACVVLLALFLALDPCVTGSRIQPSDQYVLLLFDDSQSMRVEGAGGVSRGGRLLAIETTVYKELTEALRKKYQVVQYRFGEQIERLERLGDLSFSQSRSDITGAVRQALREWNGYPVTAVILFSDGIQQPALPEADLLSGLSATPPVFTVGLDDEGPWRDIRITRLSVRRTHFDRSPVVVNVDIEATGLAGEEAVIEVIESGKTVQSQRLAITGPEQLSQVRLEFIPAKPEWLEYEARVRLASTGPVDSPAAVKDIRAPGKDRLTQNNSRRFLADNTPKKYRILYVSARPNWEHKFIREALREDEQLQLTSLIMISAAERKFVYRGSKTTLTNPLYEGFGTDAEQFGRYDEPIYLRLGASESELKKGYPSDEEELFPFHLIIWGDVGLHFFQAKPLELTRAFVDRRGGSLLVLAGRDSMLEERPGGHPIASLLPVIPTTPDPLFQELSATHPFQAVPAREGELSGAWALDPDPETNQKIWGDLPLLYNLVPFALVRPGAAVYARSRSETPELDNQPLFVIQRFGHGRCAVLAMGETWPWQMHTGEDHPAFARLWRQVIRHLVIETPQPVAWREKRDAYLVSEPVRFDLVIRDPRFNEREGLRTTAEVTTPSGRKIPLGVEESIQEAGLYACEFQPQETGLHRLSVQAADEQGEAVGSLDEAFLVAPDESEFQNPRYDPVFLQEIASRTGGEFISIGQTASLASRIPWTPDPRAETARLHLWHNPLFFFLLAAMLSVEWYARRKRGCP
ncbi:MAG TPA: hypothetical protein PK878_06135 [bacterium]|nr:hypothetical protein [bacterium]HPO99878.1 hypothetical protein [bacterium]